MDDDDALISGEVNSDDVEGNLRAATLADFGLGGSYFSGKGRHKFQPASRDDHFDAADYFFHKSKNLPFVRAILLRSIKIFGASARELLLLSAVEERLNLVEEAELRLEELLQDDPSNALACARLGGIRLRKLRDPVGALQPLHIAVREGLAGGELLRDVADACAAAGHEEDAARSFDRLVDSGEASAKDYSARIRYLIGAGQYRIAADTLQRAGAEAAGDEWFVRELVALVTATYADDRAEAVRIVTACLAEMRVDRQGMLAPAMCSQFATLYFFRDGLAAALTWLDGEAVGNDSAHLHEAFCNLLHLFLSHELAHIGLSQARQRLLAAQKQRVGRRSRDSLELLAALLSEDAPHERSGRGPAGGWRDFVRRSASDGPPHSSAPRAVPGVGLWSKPDPQREQEIDPSLIAQMVRAVVAHAPRGWLAPQAFLDSLIPLRDDDRLAIAEALTDSGQVGAADAPFLLTLAKRVLDTPAESACDERKTNLAKRIGPLLRNARMNAGIHDPSDALTLDAIKDERNRLKSKVEWLARTGRIDDARASLQAAAAGGVHSLALYAIDLLADIGYPDEAEALVAKLSVDKPNFNLLVTRYRLSVYRGDEDTISRDLLKFLQNFGSLGKPTRVSALLLLDQIDEALAEAELLAELQPDAAAVLPAISVALLEWRYDVADRHLLTAIGRVRSELERSSSALGTLQHIVAFFQVAQQQAQQIVGTDLASLADIEALVLDMIRRRETLDARAQRKLFSCALKFSTTLLRLSHTQRALRITRVLRRMAHNDLGRIHQILSTYQQRSYNKDPAVAAELTALLIYARALAVARSSGIAAVTAGEAQMRDLSVALTVAATLYDAPLLAGLAERSAAILTRLQEDGPIATPAAAALAATVVAVNAGPAPGPVEFDRPGRPLDVALRYLEACHRHHPTRSDFTSRLVAAYRNLGRLDEADRVRKAAKMFMPFVAAGLAWQWSETVSDRLVWYRSRLMPPDPAAIKTYASSVRSGSMRQITQHVGDILGRRAPSTGPVRGVVFLGLLHRGRTPALAALPCAELQKQGIAIISLADDELRTPPTGDPRIDEFDGILRGNRYVRGHPWHVNETYLEWEVDWGAREVMCLGMNFWQTIFDRMAGQLKGFNIDSSTISFQRTLRELIMTLDRALYVCELIYNKLASADFPIRLASSHHTYPPVSAFKLYCQEKGWRRNMHFIGLGVGYENYFSNMENQFTSTVAAIDTTRFPSTRGVFFAVPERFEAWYQKQDQNELQKHVAQWINVVRAGVGAAFGPEALQVCDRVARHREAGGQVVGVFGKIPFDIGVPYMGGPAHTDMADWINHTVEVAARSSALVLIKPHPHELRGDVAGRIRERFLDLIKCKIPDNVVLLGHNWFNSYDMVEMIDVGVLWSGTTSLELGASGVRVVVCDDWALKDYPVGHLSPHDREDYEAMIIEPAKIPYRDDEYQKKCAALLNYLSTDEVMRPYPYFQVSATNAFVGAPLVNWIEIEKYFQFGDVNVEKLAREFSFGVTSSTE